MNKEIGFEFPANSNIAQSRFPVTCIFNNGRLGVGVLEVYPDKVIGLCALDHDERMHTIGSFSTVAIVYHLVLASGPHSIGSLLELEVMDSLTKAKDSLRRKLEIYLNELVSHHKRLLLRRE